MLECMGAAEEEQLFLAIRRLNEIGIALSRDADEEHLLETILLGAKELTQADAGTIYSLRNDRELEFRIVRTDSLAIALGGTSMQAPNLPPVQLYDQAGGENHASVVAHAVLANRTVCIDDAYETDEFDFSTTRAFDEQTGYRSTSLLTVPMRDHRGDIIGVLQLLNAQRDGVVIPFAEASVRLVESLASQASITLSNTLLAQHVSELFESFVKLIATAIDEKSPFTGNHCRRVPELTMRLADAAHRAAEGPLADFTLTAEDRYEITIASWLHDCGKITTPEWVLDKATKLQCINDRINEIASRFAACLAQAEAMTLRAVLNGADKDVEMAHLADVQRELQEDLAFVRRVNFGSEFMQDEDVARVSRIATRLWTDADGADRPILSNDEVKNMTIRKGTLTAEERAVLNHHIVATIDMLNALPFPKHLRRVPEIAGGHHERMDGKGYPKGLTRDEMSVPARCMGIADVFEALTADDRPYKQAMTLTEALTILGKMKLDNHIDPDLFDVFIESKIWLEYANEFLNPAQIDEVDVASIPGVNVRI